MFPPRERKGVTFGDHTKENGDDQQAEKVILPWSLSFYSPLTVCAVEQLGRGGEGGTQGLGGSSLPPRGEEKTDEPPYE